MFIFRQKALPGETAAAAEDTEIHQQEYVTIILVVVLCSSIKY